MERLPQNASYDEWNHFGPVNQNLPTEEYDGFGRKPPEHPRWANLKVGGPNQVLGNPNHPYGADAFSAGHAQYTQFMNVLDKGGKDALRLIREAGKRGNDVVESAMRIGGDENAWTCIAPDEKTAAVVRSLVTTALEFYPPAKGVHSQKLPKTVEEIDMKAFAASFEKKAMPPRWRSRTIDAVGMRLTDEPEGDYHTFSGQKLSAQEAAAQSAKQSNQRNLPAGSARSQKFDGVLALYADTGMAPKAQEWTGRLPKNLIVAPMGGDISSKLTAIKRRTHMMANGKNLGPNKKPVAMSTQVIDGADAVAVFWNGDHTSKGAQIIAEAARAGKIAKILDGNGKEMPLWESARTCMDANMSKKEYAQSRTLGAFELSASEPAGRFALSLVRSEKLGRLSDKDYDQLATMGGSINEISDMAKTSQGAEYLGKEQKISSAAIRLLADEKVMSSARDSFIRINKHLSENDVSLIGPEDYPISLLASGQKPPFLFVQGPVDVFRNAQDTHGIVGDNAVKGDDVRSRLAASRIAPATSAVAATNATVVRAEHATSMDVPVNKPQILVIGSGHAHVGNEAAMLDRERVLENGGVVVSHLPPEETSSVYSKADKARVGIAATGNDHTTNKAAALVGAMSDILLVTDIDRGAPNSPAHAAVSAALDVPNAPRRPVVVNAHGLDNVDSMSGNRAMLSHRGTTALAKAGFGNRTVEKHQQEFKDGHVAIDLGRDPALGAQNMLRLTRREELVLPEKAAKRDRDQQVL